MMSAGNCNGFVRVMRSHDYNQFEVCLPLPERLLDLRAEAMIRVADDLRKDAARLVDKAVAQYESAKRATEMCERLRVDDGQTLRMECEKIMLIPEEKRTPYQKGKIAVIRAYDHWKDKQDRYADGGEEFPEDPEDTAF